MSKHSYPNKSNQQHSGELFVQQKRNAPEEMSSILSDMISPVMPVQHSTFFEGLSYFPLGSVDANGWPWASLLCSPTIDIVSEKVLRVSATVPSDDPFVKSTKTSRFFAGIGIDFTNRRRNKVAGFISRADLQDTSGCTQTQELHLTLATNENMGNCPKYITHRRLRSISRVPGPAVHMNSSLDTASRRLLSRCSTLFMATKHSDPSCETESDMGFNHRGGTPGFIRYFEDTNGGEVVLPDYSGNQFYQSLGNVQSDGVVGLIALDFESGDTLQLTGEAVNLFDEEAEAVMPRTTLLTIVTIKSAVFIPGALQLELVGLEQLSPYNPPLRLLASEIIALGRLPPQDQECIATLVRVQRNCSSISTFTFRLSSPMQVPPGGYVVFDFSHVLPKRYEHMNRNRPNSVNDDHIRTWTVSDLSHNHMEISVTVKHVAGGLVSSFLHSLRAKQSLQILAKGFGGGFSLFTSQDDTLPSRMLWLAAGVGLTPFLSLYRYLKQNLHLFDKMKITLLYSCRGDEVLLVEEFISDHRVQVVVFDSSCSRPSAVSSMSVTMFQRRLTFEDLQQQQCDMGGEDSAVFLCGPKGYMSDAGRWLESAGWPVNRVWQESFAF